MVEVADRFDITNVVAFEVQVLKVLILFQVFAQIAELVITLHRVFESQCCESVRAAVMSALDT